MTKQDSIPKIIHYVWLGGNEKPQSVLDCIESWRERCPDYEIVEWNETNFDTDGILWVKESMAQKKYAFASDVIRLYALYERGGVYFDTDVIVKRSFDALLASDAFIGYENQLWLGTAVIGAKKGNFWIKRLLDYYKSRPLLIKGKIDTTSNVMAVSAITEAYFGFKMDGGYRRIDLGAKGNISIYPSDYFFPKNYMTHKLTLTENSYAIHDFALVSSWWSPGERAGAAFARGARRALGRHIFGFFEWLVMRHFIRGINKSIKKQAERDSIVPDTVEEQFT
ncbi:MAG: hypothetical protein LBH24_00125 [Clostridiales bacterium]|jgi:hypothetical protein|nr:hypothetical protein [Clostridiales bacterium]